MAGLKLATIPGQPGMRVDASILAEVRRLLAAYPVKVTAAYAPPGVGGHAANGDHPQGLALDLVPDTARGGTWRDVDALAHWAEPSQNHPLAGVFRWVGYDGDPGHGDPAHAGKNAHLHLSFLRPGSSKNNGGGVLSTAGDVAGHAAHMLVPFGALSDVAHTALGAPDVVGTAAGDVAGAAGGVAADAATATANALLGIVTDAVGKGALKWALYAGLVLGGLALILAGAARTAGVNKSTLGGIAA